MNLPQLQRDLREVENELRLARNRLSHYETLGEQALATDARRVVEGHELLKQTLTTRIIFSSNRMNTTDPYGPSDEFDPTPQHEYPMRDLPDEPVLQEPEVVDRYDDDQDEGYEGQQCPACGYDLDRDGDCTGNGCGADLSS